MSAQRVWDELDVWHSCLAALEVDMQDLENPEEALMLTERLVEVQQLHSQLAKQAEQRTTLISKVGKTSKPFRPLFHFSNCQRNSLSHNHKLLSLLLCLVATTVHVKTKC